MMLQVDSIDLHYGAAQALRNVSLSAQAGKVTCILGRNGVGKTSLLDALAGQHAISRGAITFDGEDITPLKRDDRSIPDDVFALFPVLNDMLGRRGGDLSGGQQQQLAIGRALVMRPRLLLLDEPTEGIQPSIIKDIARAIAYLRNLGRIAVVLVEQYLDFARELGDHFAVMDRGAIVYSCSRDTMDEAAVRRAMAI